MNNIRKLFLCISLVIIYILVRTTTTFDLWQEIIWFIGVFCYSIACGGEENR